MKDNKTIKIGISSIGSGVGQSVINSIRLSNLDIKTFGFGTNPLAYGLYECDEFVESLSFYAANYVDDTIQKILANQIDIYIPGHDDDAHICAKHIEQFAANGIQVIVAGHELLNICRDKELMSNYLNPIANIFVKSFDKSSFVQAFKEKEIDLPVIAKPRDGFASRGIEIINFESDFSKITDVHIVQELAIPNKNDREHDYYLTQLKKGINPQISEISIQLVADENGDIIGRMISYNKLNNGVPIEIIPFEDENVWTEVNKLIPTLQSLGLKGPFNLQGRLTDNGLKLFEMNARFTGITGLRAFMGFNEVEACIKSWLGIRKPDETLIFNHRRFGIRQTADKAIDLDRNSKVFDIYRSINKAVVKNKKNVLITGATGYLGRNLVRELLSSGDENFEIWCLSRDKSRLEPIFGERVKMFDFTDLEDGQISMGNVDILLHAGFARPHCSTTEIAESIAFSTKIITQAFQNQVANIINISSQSVYGQGEAIPWNENSEVNTASVYSAAKFAIEQLIVGLKRIYPHVNATSIRLGTLTGGAEGLVNIDLLSKMVSNVILKGKVTVYGGSQIIERLDIRDATAGLILLLKNTSLNWRPHYNLGSGKQYKLSEIVEIIEAQANLLSYDLEIEHNPDGDDLKFGLDIDLFKKDFKWNPQFALDDTILSLFTHLKSSLNV